MTSNLKIGVDIGGTFTDLVLIAKDKPVIHKVLSTPENPARAVLSGISEILVLFSSLKSPLPTFGKGGKNCDGNSGQMDGCEVDSPVDIVHGTTVGANALLERKGARTALITTEGFEDIIEIGRQNRPELYDFFVEKPAPLVPSELRFGLSERTLHTGEILQPVEPKEVEVIKRKLSELGVQSIAVCFLFSYANSENEATVRQILQEMNLPISASHLIVPEYREYERCSTTVVNAYIAPVMRKYIKSLEEQTNGSLRIMQSNGGSISAKTACEQPVRTILSGPAGGVVGALEIARLAGFEKIITFDMGGTSTDVSLCDGAIKITTEGGIGGWPIKVPIIDMHTVGAGGGSIAYLDEGGALRVGPESAGADPGPICYGKGHMLTVTDANLFLGRLDPDYFLGGAMKLESEKVHSAMVALAGKLGFEENDESVLPQATQPKGYTPEQAAEGIIKVVNATMERAIRVISVERGYDTREFALVSFGGAGGLHACELAQRLSIPIILVPKNAGILSAFGMLIADIVKSYSQTILLKAKSETTYGELLQKFKNMEDRARREMMKEGFKLPEILFQRTLDMRYEGQSYEINVAFDELFGENFTRAYTRRFGYQSTQDTIEVVNLRLNARVSPPKPATYKEKRHEPEASKAIINRRKVVIEGNTHEVTVYDRDLLQHGNMVDGPAIIVEYSATTLIPPGFICQVDEYGNLLIEV